MSSPSPSAVLQRHSKSFALASRLLPRETRDEVATLYAWCRRADDAIDLSDFNAQPALLRELDWELERIYRGAPQSDPLLAAFQRLVEKHRIPKAYPQELLRGLEMDVMGKRYDSVAALLLYCHRVAGVVGLMMCHVLGVCDAAARRHAAHLGIAMQLTNICRDVAEDWRRGRLYIPVEIQNRVGSGGLRSAVRELLDLADRFYASGDRGIWALPARAALAVRSARLVYSAIGTRIRARDYDVVGGRSVVPLGHKLVLVCRALISELARRLFRSAAFRRAPLTEEVRFPGDVLPV